VPEAAEAFARQLVERPELSQTNNQQVPRKEIGSKPPAMVVRQPGLPRAPPHVQQQPQREVVVLLDVAGVASKENGESDDLTEAEFVATNKRKGPSCFRCRKNGHFFNDRE
jgi:hypothetical protein